MNTASPFAAGRNPTQGGEADSGDDGQGEGGDEHELRRLPDEAELRQVVVEESVRFAHGEPGAEGEHVGEEEESPVEEGQAEGAALFGIAGKPEESGENEDKGEDERRPEIDVLRLYGIVPDKHLSQVGGIAVDFRKGPRYGVSFRLDHGKEKEPEGQNAGDDDEKGSRRGQDPGHGAGNALPVRGEEVLNDDKGSDQRREIEDVKVVVGHEGKDEAPCERPGEGLLFHYLFYAEDEEGKEEGGEPRGMSGEYGKAPEVGGGKDGSSQQ